MKRNLARAMPFLVIALLGCTSLLAQSVRPNLPPGGTNWVLPMAVPESISTTDLTVLTPTDLVGALVGPGVVTSNITYTGAVSAAGTFTGGGGIIGFNSGVILGSGNIASTPGPNVNDGITTNQGTPGDPDLNTLSTFPTFDAAVLEFDFSCPGTQVISFQYVFTSDEYNEYVNSQYNDVFAFFVNGVNIAIVPGTPNTPVTINNVNCNNPYGPPTGVNCGQYINNDPSDGGGLIDTEMDGLTLVFTATAVVNPGVNHIKLAIADASDTSLDSNVFILGSSFQCALPGPVFEPPTPGLCLNAGPQAATEGVPYSHPLDAIATNGLAGQNVTITSVVGTTLNGNPAAFPAGASHTPPLPVTGQPALATFDWTPTSAEVGTWQFTYNLIDQLGNVGSCTIEVEVASTTTCVATVVTNLGGGCGAPAPVLGMTLPIAGSTLSFYVGSSASNAPVVLVASLPPFGSALGLVPPCSLQVDLVSPSTVIMDQYVTDSAGNWKSSVQLAAVPEMVGLTFRIQAGVVATGGPMSNVMMTDALQGTIGTCPPCTATREQWVDLNDPVGQLFQAHWVATFPACMEVGVLETMGGNAYPNAYHFHGDVAGRDALYAFLANLPPLLPPGTPPPPFVPIQADAINPTMSVQGCSGSATRYAAVLQLNIVFNASGDLGSLPSVPTIGNMIYVNPGDPFSGLNVFQIWEQTQLILGGVLPLPPGHTCQSFVNLLEELSLSFVDCTPSAWAQNYLFAI